MRIQSINVANLRGVELAQIEPQQLTYLLGHNGEGKSTVLGALRWALSGWLQWTDKKGTGAADLVRHGAKGAVVEVATDEFTVRREIGGKAKAIVVDGETGKDAEARLLVTLPRAEVLDCLLTPVAFTALDRKSQQDILFSLVDGSTVDAAWVRGKLAEAEQAALADDLATILTGQRLFEVLHKAAYDKRTKANGRRDGLRKVLDAATQGSAEDEPEGEDETRSVEELEEAARAAGEAYLAASTAAKSAEARQATHVQAAAAVERWRSSQVRAEEELANYAAPAAAKTTRERVAELNAADAEAKAAMEALRGDLAGVRGQLVALEPQVERFAAGEGGACLVLSTVACPLSAEQRAEALEQARAQIADLREQETALSEQVEAALKAANEAIAAHREAHLALEKWAGYEQRVKDLKRDVGERTKELERAQAALEQAPPQDTAALDVALTAADVELWDATKALEQARELQARREAAATASAVTAANTETELQEAEQEWQTLETLVKRLEPAGLPAEANRDLVGGVLDKVNEALGGFTDFALDCEPGADFKLLVKRGGSTTPVAFLSSGEQYIIGVACQVAFAILTGFGVVVVDGADVLDTHNHPPLLAMLYNSGVQAIVAATPKEAIEPGQLPTRFPAGPGIVCYWMDGGSEGQGTATVLGETAEREAA